MDKEVRVEWGRAYPGGEPSWTQSSMQWASVQDRQGEQQAYEQQLRNLGVFEYPKLQWFTRTVTVTYTEAEEVVDEVEPEASTD